MAAVLCIRPPGPARGPTPIQAAAIALALLANLGCATVVSGVDGEALGYGPPHAALAGYDEDPVPRPRVSPWTPPAREPSSEVLSLGELMEASEPVPYIAEVQSVCAKLGELGSEDDEAACLRHHRIARLFRTMDKWKALVGCVEAATTLDDARACEPSYALAIDIPSEYPRETDTCLHVLALTIVETAGPEPMMSAQELGELAPVMFECVDSLVLEQREERGPKAYFEILDCIDASLSTADAEACEID